MRNLLRKFNFGSYCSTKSHTLHQHINTLSFIKYSRIQIILQRKKGLNYDHAYDNGGSKLL
jgi:hypothetical protein